MIKHIMADGTEAKSIAGRVVPINDRTAQTYQLLVKKGVKEK